MPDIERVDSEDEIPCLKWTIYKGRRKICVNFQNCYRQGEHSTLPIMKQHVSQGY